MEPQRNPEALLEAFFALLLGAVFACAILAARNLPFKAAFFPTVIGVPGLILALVVCFRSMGQRRKSEENPGARPAMPGDLFLDDALLGGEALKRTVIIFAWMIGLFLGSWLLGQQIALPLFVFLYLKVGSRERWILSVAVSLATGAFLVGVFDEVIHVSWHEGMLFLWLGINFP